jgi:hypothetical protein
LEAQKALPSCRIFSGDVAVVCVIEYFLRWELLRRAIGAASPEAAGISGRRRADPAAPERDDDAGAQADCDCNQVLPRWQTIASSGRLCGIAAPQFLMLSYSWYPLHRQFGAQA